MNAPVVHRSLLVTLAGATMLVLTACSERTGPPQPALSAAQSDSVAEVVVADAQAELDAATAAGGAGFVPGEAPPTLPLLPPVGCRPAVAPASPLNSDADRVLDSVRLTFADCVFTLRRGSDTVRGVIDVVDPTPTVTDRAIKLAFTDFTRIMVGRTGRLSSFMVNGSRQVIRDADHVAQTAVDFRTDYVFGDGSVASHVRNWDVLFTADVAGTIRPDAWLPGGTLTLTGNSTFTHGDHRVTLDVSTPTQLHFDPACADRPKFDTGTLIVVATRNGTTATLTITFTGCGQYTLTKS